MNFLAQHPWAAISIGTILVVIGGLLATWGWNQRSELQHQDNLITAVAEEWRLNEQMIVDVISLARSWNTRGDSESFPYHPFKSFRAKALITSGVFNDTHNSLIQAIKNYEIAIAKFTASQKIVGRHNPGIYLKRELIHKPPKSMPKNEEELLATPFIKLLSEHRQLGEFLSSQNLI